MAPTTIRKDTPQTGSRSNEKENSRPPSSSNGGGPSRKRLREDADEEIEEEVIRLAPRRRGGRTDRLVHHGRHFGRTVSTFANMKNLVDRGVSRTEQLSNTGVDIEDLEESEQRDHALFNQLLKMVPGLEERLFDVKRTEEEFDYIAEMLQKGINTARADDVKTLKSAVIDWITPTGGVLSPALPRNVKSGRGFHHDVTGHFLCPTDYDWSDENVQKGLRTGKIVVTGLQWPRLMYSGCKFNSEQMWEGLLRSKILVQAYKHIFTSPSSVDGENRATRSGNAQLHGMTSVTLASLVYVTTLVRFSLSSAGSFSRTDIVTDSERFHNTLLEFLECPEETEQVDGLLQWWNDHIFPAHTPFGHHSVPKTSALAKLKEQRRKGTLSELSNA